MIDLRLNPICELAHPEHPLVRYQEELPASPSALAELSAQASASSRHGAQALALNATALRLPAVPAPRPHQQDPRIIGNCSRIADSSRNNLSLENHNPKNSLSIHKDEPMQIMTTPPMVQDCRIRYGRYSKINWIKSMQDIPVLLPHAFSNKGYRFYT
ncbi:uncharacterized protein LOC114353058 [Ostrinia furnacalis]|uniref:uncharacterized protein LOC114353058 n=1 Tax=Ostrinia furnacalis TaxID=93504 RepID=UPI001040A9C1|nr:uncharacterized protein LOC114353058 [Ostrinia furnacalis]